MRGRDLWTSKGQLHPLEAFYSTLTRNDLEEFLFTMDSITVVSQVALALVTGTKKGRWWCSKRSFILKRIFSKNATMQNWFYKLLDCKTLQKILDFFSKHSSTKINILCEKKWIFHVISQLFWMFMTLLKREKTDPSESSTITAVGYPLCLVHKVWGFSRGVLQLPTSTSSIRKEIFVF